MTSSGPLHFDELPDLVRVGIFLLLGPSDLNTCLKVSTKWKRFIQEEILRSERNKNKVATYRHAFGKIITDQAIDVDTMWMLATYDEAENNFYVLSKPASGQDWTLKQYACADGLRERKAVTLVTDRFARNMQVVGGHLVIFKQLGQNGDNAPVVFRLESIPWGGRMPIESGIQMPNDAFHIKKLLLGKDSLFFVSKNAHVTWTSANGGQFTHETHEPFADKADRPVVVHRLAKNSEIWEEKIRLHPEHPFEVMEKFSTIPNKVIDEQYKDQTCHLYLSNNIITEKFMLVSCPLHGSYECFDFEHDFSMWKVDMTRLPFENVRAILKDSLNNSSNVLAAIRDAYVFIYHELGTATLLSVESGQQLRKVPGRNFVLTPRFVLPVESGGKKKGLGVTVVDAVSGDTSEVFTFQRLCVLMDAFGDMPWHHDDRAYADFAGIAKQLLPDGPKWPVFQQKAESYWGFGHAMIDPSRMVCWSRLSSNKFKVKLASLKLDFEQLNVIEVPETSATI